MRDRSRQGPALDSGTAWIVASASHAVLTIAFGAPLLSAVALKPIAADLHTARAAPSAAGSFTYIGGAFGGILAGWLSGRIAIRWIVSFGAVMLSAGLVVSASGGLLTLYVGHGGLMGLRGTSCMFSPLVTYGSTWFDRSRGAAVALVSSGESVSGALWPILFQAGVGNLSWRSTMMVYGGFEIVAILLLAVIFLREPPEAVASSGAAMRGQAPRAPVVSLPPNAMMISLMVAVFCCCVPMSIPMQHVVAFSGDLGFASAHGAAMLSVLLGSPFIARMLWGALADKVGGLRTLFWSSLAQMIALSGFLLTRNEAALFVVSAAFGFGLSGLLPAYVITIREFFPASEANWRVPTVLFAGYVGMASGGWGAGAIYDHFGQYAPVFGFGIVLNVVNLPLLLALVVHLGGFGRRPSPA